MEAHQNQSSQETLHYRQAFSELWPELKLNSFTPLGEGMDSVVFIANEHWIARFPKFAKAGQSLEREIKLLPALAKKLDLEIPQFHRWGTTPNGLVFVVYPSVPGQALNPSDWRQGNTSQQQQWANTLSSFLAQIHAFPPDCARAAGVPTVDSRSKYLQLREDLRSLVWCLFTPAEQALIARRFDEFLANQGHFDFQAVLLHGDLSPEHIFYDPKSQEILSIIDFGDLCLGDPDYDLMYLYMDYGAEIIDYMGLATPKRLDKVAFYYFANPLEDIVFHYHTGSSSGVQAALSWWRNELRN